MKYFLITAITEGVVIFVLFKNKNYLYYSLLCNMLTNPALNYLLSTLTNIFGSTVYYPGLILLEIAVVIIEAKIYRYLGEFNLRQSLLLSFFLNAITFVIGLLIS